LCVTDLSGSAFGLLTLETRNDNKQNRWDVFSGTSESHQDRMLPLSEAPATDIQSREPTHAVYQSRSTNKEPPGYGYNDMPMEKLSLATAHFLGNMLAGDDVDISMHEIHLEQNELEQFDAEFSDLGDSDQGDPDINMFDYQTYDETGQAKKFIGLNYIPMPLPEEIPSFSNLDVDDDNEYNEISEDVVDQPSPEKVPEAEKSAARNLGKIQILRILISHFIYENIFLIVTVFLVCLLEMTAEMNRNLNIAQIVWTVLVVLMLWLRCGTYFLLNLEYHHQTLF